MSAQEPAFRTIEGTADYFGVNEVTVRRWVRAGLLPAVKVGKVVRFRQEDIDAFVAAHRVRRGVSAA